MRRLVLLEGGAWTVIDDAVLNSRFGKPFLVERIMVELRVRLEAHASTCDRRDTNRIGVGHTQAAEFVRP
jgi:hypothetical protein